MGAGGMEDILASNAPGKDDDESDALGEDF